MRIVVVGAGPGGICIGAQLREAGFTDFVILERAPRPGGTWWHNRFPGAECDVQSLLYSFSFALKADWTKPYATQPEILRYLDECIVRFGLQPHLRLGVEVTSARWMEADSQWLVDTADGDSMTADVLVSAVGMFNRPKIPDLPGMSRYEGQVVHSARWPADLRLEGLEVALVGTAASAIQIAPEIAPGAKRLWIYQRTATWVLPKDDEPFSEATIETFRSNPAALHDHRLQIWREFQRLTSYEDATVESAERAGRENLLCVRDERLRAQLTPAFRFGAKRPLFSNKYYPMFNRENVGLVTSAIDRLDGRHLVTRDGERRRADVTIFATGFHTTEFASALDIRGRGGSSLRECWAPGAQAYLGITTAGFPNLFMLYGPNTNSGSIIHVIECQAGYVVRHLQRMAAQGLRWIEVRRAVQDFYNQRVQAELARMGIYAAEDVNTYYRTETGRIVTQSPYQMKDYRELTGLQDDLSFTTG
jgi:cyclohexanone monooxygenase